AAQVQGLARALRDAHAQASDRHPRPDAEDRRRADAHRPSGQRRRQHPVGAEIPMSDRQLKGILGTKLGMTQVFDENNRVVPVTVVKAGPNVVTRIRTPERDGYSAVQVAYGEISPRKVNKPVTGQYAAAGVNPRRHLAELRLDTPDAAAEYEVGQELTAEIF